MKIAATAMVVAKIQNPAFAWFSEGQPGLTMGVSVGVGVSVGARVATPLGRCQRDTGAAHSGPDEDR